MKWKFINQTLKEKELPLSFRSVKTVAAMKNTIEMATQKCYKKQNEKHFQCNQASKNFNKQVKSRT